MELGKTQDTNPNSVYMYVQEVKEYCNANEKHTSSHTD